MVKTPLCTKTCIHFKIKGVVQIYEKYILQTLDNKVIVQFRYLGVYKQYILAGITELMLNRLNTVPEFILSYIMVLYN